MRVIAIASKEAAANWRRNGLFALILLVASLTQMAALLSTAASREAVTGYGAAVFGYAETYASDVSRPLGNEDVAGTAAVLQDMQSAHPWFRPALAVPVVVRHPGDDPATDEMALSAVAPEFAALSPALSEDPRWPEVADADRRSPVVLVSDQDAAGPFPRALRLALSEEGVAMNGDPGGTVGLHAVDVIEIGPFSQPNRSLDLGDLTGLGTLDAFGPAERQVRVFYRCTGSRCADTRGLLANALELVGASLGESERLDRNDELAPLLAEQRRTAGIFTTTVLLLATVAVAIVSSAFVEVRAPQFATLRTLGATRAGISLIALFETVLAAAVTAVVSVGVGALVVTLDPNRFNRIPGIRIDSLDVPASAYLQTVGVTLAVGLVSGLLPAVRAYWSVRTS